MMVAINYKLYAIIDIMLFSRDSLSLFLPIRDEARTYVDESKVDLHKIA